MDSGPFRRIEKVSAPLKGSFPLDYKGDCKLEMLKYMICLNEHKSKNSECRMEAKNYFSCRMERGLMDKDDWKTLGYKDTETPNDS
ncbi:Cytochrome c oxidase assembly protein COX19 [Strongyloides ratti]|uniref:Cytochrome c oxidase assembly protein COX19 n=1 Tax=Strongyloides ratti TaxID=34506 RepID=A0A090LA81_STRRB|nr:Cytochrome c oxidase assembly protein COX19 [Strongyloides ratti]CEF64430.1 Cytochrome c oxidase assembly protein COX19 [Strongyloides ratti]